MSELSYLKLAKHILNNGVLHENRTGVDTKRMLGETLKFDLSNNSIPMFTTKKVFWKGVAIELAWFLSGQTNGNFLKKHGVKFWNEWLSEDGSLGPVYGKQFRDQTTLFKDKDNNLVEAHIDPLRNLIDGIKKDPGSRRHIISLWNGPEIQYMNLPCCHGAIIQASVHNGELTLEMYQRSSDMFLGVPFNVASYSLFTHILAKDCGLVAKEFIWHGHDCHVYTNHEEQLNTQLGREIYSPPTLEVDLEEGNLLEWLSGVEYYSTSEIMDKFQLKNYKHHDAIKAEVAV